MGIESVREETRNFLVNASAAKYVADVARYSSKDGGILWRRKEVTNPMETSVLFSGGISIYKKGQIPGTEIDGKDLATNGKIWAARECGGGKVGEISLSDVVFGGEIFERDKDRFIRQVVNGYQVQADKKAGARSSVVHNSYRRGAMDHHEKTYETFGSRVPFGM
jgi:hypothetical protein